MQAPGCRARRSLRRRPGTKCLEKTKKTRPVPKGRLIRVSCKSVSKFSRGASGVDAHARPRDGKTANWPPARRVAMKMAVGRGLVRAGVDAWSAAQAELHPLPRELCLQPGKRIRLHGCVKLVRTIIEYPEVSIAAPGFFVVECDTLMSSLHPLNRE